MRDTIPKSIGYFLVKSSQERLQFELYSQINKNDHLTKSLGEPERVAEERKSLIATLETLRKAIKVLSRDPDITNTAFGEDELEEQLRQDAMQRRREEEQKRGPPGGGMAGQQPQSRAPQMSGPPQGGMPPGGMAQGGVRPMGPGGPPPGMNPGVRPGGPGGPLGGPGGPGNTGNLFGNQGPLGANNGAPAK